jgi:hypothetical protein
MMLTNETGREIIVKFEHGDQLVVQPFKSFNKDLFVGIFGVIKSVRFKK